MNSESDTVELTESEMMILKQIADAEHISYREVLSRAIFFLASKVDYTNNFQTLSL